MRMCGRKQTLMSARLKPSRVAVAGDSVKYDDTGVERLLPQAAQRPRLTLSRSLREHRACRAKLIGMHWR